MSWGGKKIAASIKINLSPVQKSNGLFLTDSGAHSTDGRQRKVSPLNIFFTTLNGTLAIKIRLFEGHVTRCIFLQRSSGVVAYYVQSTLLTRAQCGSHYAFILSYLIQTVILRHVIPNFKKTLSLHILTSSCTNSSLPAKIYEHTCTVA